MLNGFPVLIEIPIQWGDMDSFGHVNNTMYLRWAETARVEYLKRVGIWQRKETDNVGPILAAISCNFRRPLTYPDTVKVGARITHIGNSSFVMVHQIVSASGEAAADLESTLVLVDYNTGKPLRVPDEMRRAVAEIEGSGK